MGQPEYGEFSLLDHMRDPSLYHQQVSKLPNRKSAGPDSIPNELLKHLPEAAHMAIHKLFVLMWMTGSTPTAWKESCTVLIHKKGDASDLGNWRPIALANTIYKLWTSMVTQCLTKHAEHYDILSSSQEGFRAEKNTIRQLQNLMNVMSDAKICHQDLYLLYIDFSSAFNTIDHDKLLCIMHDLGFPPAAIEVVADLYTNAVTRIKLNFAVTDPIELGRGTIQGDIPSPILFLIFIEPLLRWLQSGGRGYRHKCMTNTPEDGHTISNLAYADDLAAMTNSIADMKVQAQKVQAFVSWSGMTVNCKKCAITGILYGQAHRDGSSSVLAKSMINMVKDRVRQIKIHNTEIPFYHPHTDSYRYLGVNITPTFNWAPHLERILTETKQKAERLTNCALSKAQKMRVLRTAIDPSITYSFAIGCMTELDISKFDAIRTRTCKRINGLPVSTSSAMVHQDTD